MIVDKLSSQEVSEKLSVDKSIVDKWLTKTLTAQNAGLIRNNERRRADFRNMDKDILKGFLFDTKGPNIPRVISSLLQIVIQN